VILDTNALSAIADGQADAVAAARDVRFIAIPVVVLGEYLYGTSQSRRKAEYESWLSGMLAASRILDLTAETAARYTEVRLELKRAGTPIPSNDAWIAALCRQHSFPVLSRDKHFDLVGGVRRVSW